MVDSFLPSFFTLDSIFSWFFLIVCSWKCPVTNDHPKASIAIPNETMLGSQSMSINKSLYWDKEIIKIPKYNIKAVLNADDHEINFLINEDIKLKTKNKNTKIIENNIKPVRNCFCCSMCTFVT